MLLLMQEIQETEFNPGSERSPEGGNGNPPQYSCLENFMDRGGQQATVHGVAKSRILQSNWEHPPT